MSSCDWGFTFETMRVYHDTEWGVPVHDDRLMFELKLSISVDTFYSRIRSKYASTDQLALWNC